MNERYKLGRKVEYIIKGVVVIVFIITLLNSLYGIDLTPISDWLIGILPSIITGR